MGYLSTDDVSIVLLRDSYRSLMNFMQVHTFVVFYDVHCFTVQPVITGQGCDKMSVSLQFSLECCRGACFHPSALLLQTFFLFLFFSNLCLCTFLNSLSRRQALFFVFLSSFVGLRYEHNLIFNSSEKNNAVIKTKIFECQIFELRPHVDGCPGF